MPIFFKHHPFVRRYGCMGLGIAMGFGLFFNANAKVSGPKEAGAHIALQSSALVVGNIDHQAQGDTHTLRIETNATPTYTVLRLNDPMRIVVDISGADVSGVRGPIVIEDGLLSQVAVRQYKAEQFEMGRIIVSFEKDCTYDVQTQGHAIVIQARNKQVQAPSITVANTALHASNADTSMPTAPQAKALPASRKGAALKQITEEDAQIFLRMDKTVPFESFQLDNPPRLVVDLPQTQNISQQRNYRPNVPWAKAVRIGKQRGALRVVFDLTDKKIPEVTASTDGIRVAMAQSATKRATTARTRAQNLSFAKLTDIRFATQQQGDASKMRITLKANGRIQPIVDTTQPNTWVLKLENTKLDPTLEHNIDTSAYPGVVASIASFQAETSPPSVNVVVALTGPGNQSLKRHKGDWIWDIEGDSPDENVTTARPNTAGFAANAVLLHAGPQAPMHGKRISLDVKDADILNILRLISEETGENIVASDEVKGKATLKLRNVPAEEALDTILRTKGFDKVRQNNILRIASAESIQKERDLELAKRRSLNEVEDTFIKMVTVNYATAKDIQDQVKSMLTPRGSVQVDERTNTLIIQDIRSNIDRLVELSRQLDKQTPLVNIQARIVEATTTYLRDLGIQWGGVSQETVRTGNATGLSFPGDIMLAGAADDAKSNQTLGISTPARYAVNLPATLSGQGGGLGFILGSAGGSQLLNLRLTAMESNGNGKIISSPEISTLDNKTARVSQGVEIPISVVSAAGNNTRFIPAVLELEVTPHVTNDGTVLLKILVQKSQPDFTQRGAAGDPTIQKKQAQTEVLVKDGDTSVIGGIYTRDQGDSYAEIPFLARIPLIGNLFREHQSRDNRAELLVFITPRIINRNESVVESGMVLDSVQK